MLAYKTELNIVDESFLLKLPSNFKGKYVEIIVLESFNDKTQIIKNFENRKKKNLAQKKERLLLAFKKLQEVNPIRDVIDAVEWQKQLRNEWDERIIR